MRLSDALVDVCVALAVYLFVSFVFNAPVHQQLVIDMTVGPEFEIDMGSGERCITDAERACVCSKDSLFPMCALVARHGAADDLMLAEIAYLSDGPAFELAPRDFWDPRGKCSGDTEVKCLCVIRKDSALCLSTTPERIREAPAKFETTKPTTWVNGHCETDSDHVCMCIESQYARACKNNPRDGRMNVDVVAGLARLSGSQPFALSRTAFMRSLTGPCDHSAYATCVCMLVEDTVTCVGLVDEVEHFSENRAM